jgi:uncharacterized lipoprotein YajG
MKQRFFVILLLVGVMVLANGCSPQTITEVVSPASETLAAYLNALTAKDETTLTALSCADWEANALLELDAFQSVETTLDGLTCQQNIAEDGSVTVVCEGKIVASYTGEVQEFDLSQRTYHMIEEGGDWLVCGYD